jgi:hypothetical protein
MNFGIADDPVSQDVLNRYFPAVVIIGYDGFYVYAEEEFTNAEGETEMRPVWGPKKPYAYADTQGNSLSFTLDDYMIAYEAGSQRWVEGFRSEIADDTVIPLLRDPDKFEQVRLSTIVNVIKNELAYRINRHNEYAARAGISYTFTLPVISGEDWCNTIDDVGAMAGNPGRATILQQLRTGRQPGAKETGHCWSDEKRNEGILPQLLPVSLPRGGNVRQ